jgi:hypothetical protein
VRILRDGLEHVAWLSEHGSGRQRELAAEFVSHILKRAWGLAKRFTKKPKRS